MTEPDAGLAVATSFVPADGTVTIVDPAVTPTAASVVITNRFDVGRLSISKTAAAPVIGRTVTVDYTITVANIGEIDATDVTVTDTMPAGSSFVSATDGGTFAAGVVTWQVASLPIGDTTHLGVTLSFAKPGDYVNRAAIAPQPGPWELPTLADPCGDNPTDVCSSVQLGTLAFTGSSVSAASGLALLAILLGLALVTTAWLRRRRT